jgi:hypothetical protein
MPGSPSRSIGQGWWRGLTAAGLAMLGALLLAATLVAGLVVARPARAAEVTLLLWPAGQGRIEVVQGGKDLTPDPCGFTAILDRGAAAPCELTVTTGTPLTLRAVAEPGATVPSGRENDVPDFPVAQPAFVRWSRFDCGTAATCTFTPDSDSAGDWITALFTPLQLQVGVFGVGDVKFLRSDGGVVQPPCPNSVGFGDRTCHAALPADIDVVIEATPAPTGWGLGCEPEGGDTSPHCALGMTNLRTLAFVSFDGQQPLDPPFRLSPRVKVKLGGSGQGKVTGSGGINCPSTCEAIFDYQAHVQLTAEQSTGSTFVRWVGVCGTGKTCVFSAGSATEVQARFDTAAPPTTTTSPTTTAPVTTTTATTTTSTTTSTVAGPKKPRLVMVSVRRNGGRRVVAFAVVVDRRARGIARLLKGGKTISSAGYAFKAGRNDRRLNIPRGAKQGVYRLSVKVTVGGKATTLVARVKVPR